MDYSGIVRLLPSYHPINTSILLAYGTVSTLSFRSSEFTLCYVLESLSLNKMMTAFSQTRQSLELKGINGINGFSFGSKWCCYAATINWGTNLCLAPSVKRGKICVSLTWLVKSMTPGLIGKTASVNRGKICDSWTMCDLIGQKNDTSSNFTRKALWVKENQPTIASQTLQKSHGSQTYCCTCPLHLALMTLTSAWSFSEK